MTDLDKDLLTLERAADDLRRGYMAVVSDGSRALAFGQVPERDSAREFRDPP